MNEESGKKISYYYKVVEDEEVTENDIRQALELDRKGYHVPDIEQFDIEKCMRWNENTGYKVYTMIKDPETDDVVGYINAVPVNDKCYEEIKAGKYADVDINDNDIEAYKFPNIPRTYNLYFASIVIDSKKDKFRRFFELYNAFLDKLIKLTESGIIVSRMIADAISEAGKLLCEGCGMKKIKDTDHDNSTVYEFELYPPKFHVRTPKQKELYNVLMEKYKELERNK